jgi:hypothetical protein
MVLQFNVDEVVTHERGHTFGMDDTDIAEHSNLTMYENINPSTTDKETLGLGDMLKLESLY